MKYLASKYSRNYSKVVSYRPTINSNIALIYNSKDNTYIDGLYFTPQIKKGSSHILLAYRIDLKTLVWCAFYG